METLADLFSQQILFLLAPLKNARVRSLYELALLGKGEGAAFSLVRDFRELGVLHLLVLSGTQVRHYYNALRGVGGLLCRWLPYRARPRVHLGFVWLGGWVFGAATGWPPPLSRALIFSSLSEAWPRTRVGVHVGLTFLLQVLVFPAQTGTASFFLSWASFGVVLWSERWGLRRWQSALLQTLLCQSIVIWLFGLELPGVGQAALWLGANLVLAWVFDGLGMPVMGMVLGLGFVASLLGGGGRIWECVAAVAGPLLEGIAALILVGVAALRYIGAV